LAQRRWGKCTVPSLLKIDGTPQVGLRRSSKLKLFNLQSRRGLLNLPSTLVRLHPFWRALQGKHLLAYPLKMINRFRKTTQLLPLLCHNTGTICFRDPAVGTLLYVHNRAIRRCQSHHYPLVLSLGDRCDLS
jgi:hypothetical protein